MTTARLIGGRADGWLCDIYRPSGFTYITMLGQLPRALPTTPTPDAEAILNRAHHQWEGYQPIRNLPPDPEGRIGYWCTAPLPLRRSSDFPSGNTVPDAWNSGHHRLAALEAELAVILSEDGADHWELLRQTLTSHGHPLREPPLHESETPVYLFREAAKSQK